MNANFFIKKGSTFRVTLPFDCRDQENPQIIIVPDGKIESYPSQLKVIPEDQLEYHYCVFRRPDWGLDCHVRELMYSGDGIRTRSAVSPESIDAIRLKFFLTSCSLVPSDQKISFGNENGYEALSSSYEAVIKQLNPIYMRIFLAVASGIWDGGIPIKHLLDEGDYKLLRNDPEGLLKISIAKGLISSNEEQDKKKSENMSSV